MTNPTPQPDTLPTDPMEEMPQWLSHWIRLTRLEPVEEPPNNTDTALPVEPSHD